MILSVLAAAAVATAPAPADGATVWRYAPAPVELAKYYPDAAMRYQVSGDASIACAVDAKGGLEHCVLEYETPARVGFAEATFKIATRLKMASSGAGEAPRTVHVALHFDAGRGAVTFASRALPVVPVVWAAAPSFADVLAAFPKVPRHSADVTFNCALARDGALGDCKAVVRSEWDYVGEAAARPLLKRFRAKVDPTWAGDRTPRRVILLIRFIDPAGPEALEPRVAKPDWTVTPDADALAGAYPKAARAAGVRTGRGTVQCVVAADGGLRQCAAADAQPADLGFAEAALQVAAGMKMNLWTADGGPVVGAAIRLPIRFQQPE